MGLDVYSLVRGLMNQRGHVFGNMDGDFKLPKQPMGFDDTGVESFYRFLRSKGLKISKVPQSYLLKRFKKARDVDAVGYTIGDEVFVADDYRGRPLTDAEKIAVAAHEYGHTKAGDSERDAQRVAVETLSELPHPAALQKALEFGRYEGWLN